MGAFSKCAHTIRFVCGKTPIVPRRTHYFPLGPVRIRKVKLSTDAQFPAVKGLMLEIAGMY